MNKTKKLLSATLLATCAATPLAQAQDTEVVTSPVGFITLPAAPSTDGVNKRITLAGLGMWNPVSFQGVASAVAGADVTITGAAFADDEYNNVFFVEVITGANAGIMSDIVDTTATTLTLSQDLSGMIAAGDSIRIRAHHTLNSVFGSDNSFGFTAGVNPAAADTIQVFMAGGSSTSYYYFAPASQWVTTTGQAAGDAVLYPDVGLVLRRIGQDELDVKLLGAVKEGTTAITFEEGFSIIANVYPVAVTLGGSGLYTGDANTGVLAGTSPASSDNVRILDETGNISIYYYFSPADQWVKGATPSNDVEIGVGTAFVLDRRGSAINFFQNQPF